MTFTYKDLQKEVQILSEKHLTYLELDEIDPDPIKDEIDDFKAEVQSIIESIVISKIIAQPEAGREYEIPGNTPVHTDTFFSIYASFNHTIEQNKLLKLLSSICMESEYDIIDSFIEQYDMYGNDEIRDIIQATKLLEKIHPSITTYTLANFLLEGLDFYDAIKMTLKAKGIDIEDKETQEFAEPCHEVNDFIAAFNQLLLSKIGINEHIIPNGRKSVH